MLAARGRRCSCGRPIALPARCRRGRRGVSPCSSRPTSRPRSTADSDARSASSTCAISSATSSSRSSSSCATGAWSRTMATIDERLREAIRVERRRTEAFARGRGQRAGRRRVGRGQSGVARAAAGTRVGSRRHPRRRHARRRRGGAGRPAAVLESRCARWGPTIGVVGRRRAGVGMALIALVRVRSGAPAA